MKRFSTGLLILFLVPAFSSGASWRNDISASSGVRSSVRVLQSQGLLTQYPPVDALDEESCQGRFANHPLQLVVDDHHFVKCVFFTLYLAGTLYFMGMSGCVNLASP